MTEIRNATDVRVAEIRERMKKAGQLIERRDGADAITDRTRADILFLLAALDDARAADAVAKARADENAECQEIAERFAEVAADDEGEKFAALRISRLIAERRAAFGSPVAVRETTDNG